MRRSTTIAITVLAIVTFATPLVLFLAGLRSDPNLENRAIAEAPQMSAASLLDTAMYREITDFFVDRVPLRDAAVRADAWIDVNILGDTPVPSEVLIGADGWLYNPHNFEETCIEGLPDPAYVADNADLLMSVLAKSGRAVAFTVIPQKRTVVPEMLGSLAERAACAEANASSLHAALLADPPTGYVDVWGVLIDRARAGEAVYFRDDTHWSYLGAARGAAALVEHLWPGWWSDDDLVFGSETTMTGNLVKQMGLDTTETYVPVTVARENVLVTSSTSRVGTRTQPVHVYEQSVTGGAAVPGGRTLVIGDSYMTFTADEHLAPFTESLRFIRWSTLAREEGADLYDPPPILSSEDWLLDEITRSTGVIVQTVEFRAWARFSSRRLTYLLMDALSGDLPHEDLAGAGGDVILLPGDAGSTEEGRPFLVVRAAKAADLDVRLLHRDGPDAEWQQIDTAESPRPWLAVFDLRDLPATGESAIRVLGGDPDRIRLIRIVRV